MSLCWKCGNELGRPTLTDCIVGYQTCDICLDDLGDTKNPVDDWTKMQVVEEFEDRLKNIEEKLKIDI